MVLRLVILTAQDVEKRDRPVPTPEATKCDEAIALSEWLSLVAETSSKPMSAGPASPAKPPGCDSLTPLNRRLWKVTTPTRGDTSVSFTTLAAPQQATRSFQSARKELGKKSPNRNKALEGLEKAVALYPRFAAAWNLLGETRLALGDEDLAREAFERAIAVDPAYTDPYVSLASMELKMRRLEEAVRLADRALRLNPYLAEAHFNRAVALYNLGKAESAKQILRAILGSGDTRLYPQVHEVLGEMLAAEGDFRNAAVEYRRFLELQASSRMAERVRMELADWKAKGLI